MFEILKALMAMQTACAEQDKGFYWNFDKANDGSGRAILKIEVEVDGDDVAFAEQMRELVGG